MTYKRFYFMFRIVYILWLVSYAFVVKSQPSTVNTQRKTANRQLSTANRNSQPSTQVQTESGLIKGFYNEKTSVTAYKGIPFAAPPVGELRWKAPQPAIPWKGVKECTAFGPSPMQPKPVSFLMIGPEFVVPQQPLSEDCLYLNVWTAAKSAREKRPVMIWIYGGGFQTGGAAAPGYSGEALAEQGIIFVSFNYRLGIFGFLAHPELTAESDHHNSGNYALMDMIAAISWVKKNIGAFGGDPDRITIAGQSAGSASVNCLLASPPARGLFQRAIGESGSFVLENPILHINSLASAEKEGLRIANKLNAANLKALRAIPADELQKNAGGFFAPIVDGYILPATVSETYKRNQQIHVPLLTGWNGDEGFIFGISSKEEFAKQSAMFGADSNLFRKYFPSATDSQSIASQISFAVDKTIGLSQYQWALKQNENRKQNTYLYVFTRKPPATGDRKKFGAYHTAEIGYALHTLDSIQRVWEPVDRRLEKLLSAYWVQFVKTGNPNMPGLPAWGSFSNDVPNSMIFGDTSMARLLPDKEALDFLYKTYPGK
jgi:para-nitrobenzyl esterase